MSSMGGKDRNKPIAVIHKEGLTDGFCLCGNCTALINQHRYQPFNYCPCCGQRIDWDNTQLSDLLKRAQEIANTHEYKACNLCNKASEQSCTRKEYCLPVEMFVQLLQSEDQLEQLNNIKGLFSDEE